MDKTERRVTGLQVTKDGRTVDVTCNREVIVAAGAIESPKILMQSGIGPGDHLAKFGVSSVVVSDIECEDSEGVTVIAGQMVRWYIAYPANSNSFIIAT